jgi:Tfp pilus assembly protein PilV
MSTRKPALSESKGHSSRRKSLGLSLVELVVFIVIVSAAVAGIIGVIDVTTRASVDPLIHKQALAIAEAVLEEVQLQPFTYCDPDDPVAASVDTTGATIAFQAAGAAQASLGGLTVPWPSHQANDIGLLIIENTTALVSLGANAADWTEVTNSPQTTGLTGSSDSTRLTVFWSRATSGSMGSVVVNDVSNHQIAQIVTFRGVATSGNPWDGTPAGDVAATATTAVSIPGGTTTVANTLVVAIVTNSTDSLSAQTSGFTNANLSSLLERADSNTDAGFGGGFGIATGAWATSGAYGATTATLATSSIQARMSIALRPTTACPTLAETMGPEPSETRYSSTLPFDNVNDYHGFDTNTATPSGIRSIDSTLIAGLDGYRVTVSVAGQTLGGIGNDINGNPQSLLVTVTVTGPGNTTVVLHGYRTRYAPNDLP